MNFALCVTFNLTSKVQVEKRKSLLGNKNVKLIDWSLEAVSHWRSPGWGVWFFFFLFEDMELKAQRELLQLITHLLWGLKAPAPPS